MRMVRNVVMSLAVLASAAAAQGATALWYTSPTGVGAQGQGQVLNLNCDTTVGPGSCAWVVTLRMNSASGLQGWLMDLNTAPGNGVSALNGVTNPAQPWQSGAAAGTGGSGATLLVGARGGNFGFPAAGENDLITFTLSRSFAQGNLSGADVLVRLPVASTNFYNGLVDDFETVSFGNNAGIYADNGSAAISYPNAVIHIQNVPEPTALALLAVGGIAAIRRRRVAR